MFIRILVIDATGLLGRPVVDNLTEGRRTIRILTRSTERATACSATPGTI